MAASWIRWAVTCTTMGPSNCATDRVLTTDNGADIRGGSCQIGSCSSHSGHYDDDLVRRATSRSRIRASSVLVA